MKRFLPITTELSLIREKHRVLVQYLRLSPGDSLSCTAALTKRDLRRAREDEAGRMPQGIMQTFENELGQLSWEVGPSRIQLRFLDRGEISVQLTLEGEERDRWMDALDELGPAS